ncbi:hypothetical protein AKJ51_01395 [candidate division MSBL1 archaeon SCGC-AAA382A20]|uniref:Uncharacterized protein n=1 Tax=candidate division MSBL1 archaeon SCGC-AAA382A20 TaxID=1698280 RepID=A0A133VLN7_9EURY|nr:hypothetical protein AKJ51_01395 [candidate division MSBL1 archaeon SCGC-AAA382A20]
MKSAGIISVVALAIALLILAYTGNIFSTSGHPELNDVMDDYNNEKLSFKSYEPGDKIIIQDKVEKAKYDSSRNITLVTVKSYQSHSILFRGNIKETHNTTFSLDNSEITFTITITEHKGIEHVKEFFTPKKEVV